MKKISILVSSIVLLANTITAQDAASNDKKVRFGLRITPTPTWLRSNDTKFVENGGAKFGFGFGLQAEFGLTSTASFVTGIGGDFLGGTQTYKMGQGYVLSKDNSTYIDYTKIDFTKEPNAQNSSNNDGNNFYVLNSRKVKTTYITIPLLLKLMTKDISGFKYFGAFGGNVAIQTKYRAEDEISQLNFNTVTNKYDIGGKSTVKDMRPSGDLIPLNVALNVGLGAEYNISGTTSLFLSINYIRGFINQYQATSDIMIDNMEKTINDKTISPSSGSKQSAFSDGLQINIGVLF